MTEEQFTKQHQLRTERIDLEKKKQAIQLQCKQSNYEEFKYTRLVIKWANDSGIDLENRFLLVPVTQLIELYLQAMDKEIERLRNEFMGFTC